MRYDGEHKARTRERVLKEAAAAIRADGPDRVGVAAVMARVGLTHGGFYAHFGSREDLIAEAVDYMLADAHALLFAGFDDSDPIAALNRYVDFYLSMGHRDAPERGCPIPVLAGQFDRMPQRARERFSLAVDRMTERLAVLLERAGMSEPRRRAERAANEMIGAIVLSRVRSRDLAEVQLSDALDSVRGKLGISGAPQAGPRW